MILWRPIIEGAATYHDLSQMDYLTLIKLNAVLDYKNDLEEYKIDKESDK